MSVQDAIQALPGAERDSLAPSMYAAVVLAAAMQLEGAKVGGGDVQAALARTGLRLVSIDPADDQADQLPTNAAGRNAERRLGALIEDQPCPCGSRWLRLADVSGPGAGWWHEGDEYDAREGTDYPGLFRKCYAGNRPRARPRS